MFKGKEKFVSIVIYIVAYLGVLFLVYFLLGRPVVKYSSKLKNEFRSKQVKLKESEVLVRSLPNPTKAIEDLEAKVQEFKDVGVGRRQLPKLIQMLAGQTSKSNINVVSIRPRDDIRSGNESLPAGISKVYIEMILSCNYKTFGEYLKSLNDIPASFSIESITIDKKEDVIENAEPKKPLEKAVEKPVNLMISLLLSTYMVWEL